MQKTPKGIITNELAGIAGEVIAVEIDPQLVEQLTQRFQKRRNVRIIEGSFLNHPIHEDPYKIFANIPFNRTSAIVRKILFGKNPPTEAYLVLQEEAALKFSGKFEEALFALTAKVVWDLEVIFRFRRSDFDPMPNVNAVFFRARRREKPLIEKQEIPIYEKFVAYGFGRWKRNLKLGFKPIFTYPQWKRLSKDLGFPIQSTPTELSLEQWIGLFECFQKRVPDFKKEEVMK